MARENPTWGRRRIRAELALLGYEVAELTVAKYMHRTSPRPSPTWRVFLTTHARDIVAIDFFLVPTLTFRLLFVFVMLRHERRELLHLNVTDHPTATWTARQIVEAFPDDSAPRFLLRDRDAVYGEEFARRVKSMGIRGVLTAPRAPWQNPFVERVIGSIRRDCLEQQPHPTRSPAAFRRPDPCGSRSWRAPSPLPARRLIAAGRGRHPHWQNPPTGGPMPVLQCRAHADLSRLLPDPKSALALRDVQAYVPSGAAA
jgi:transposase InsO family protein